MLSFNDSGSDHRGGMRHETLLPNHHDDGRESGWMIGYLDIMTLLVVLMVLLLTLAPPLGTSDETGLASRVPFAIPLPSEMTEALPGEPVPQATSGHLSSLAITAALGVAGPPRQREPVVPLAPALTPPTPLALLAERMPPPWRAPRPLLATAGDGGAATPPLADFVLVLTDRPPRGVQTLEPEAVAGSVALQQALDEELDDAPYLADLEGVEVSRVAEGIMLRVEDRWLFPTATAELTADGEALVQRLVEVIQRHSGAVAVEGHTDSRPIQTDEFPSNWVLSSARAIAIVHALERAGVESQRLRAVGLADTQPLADNDSAEGRAHNRRVEVIIRAH